MPMQTEYNEHTITVDERYFNFHVTGPLFDSKTNNIHSSLSLAKEAIDKRIAQQASQERERVHMPVVTDQGKLAVVTGVHARNDVLLGIDDSAYTVYPRERFITDAIAEVKELDKRRRELNGLLQRFSIRRTRGGYGRDHADKVASLKTAYEKVTKEAREYQASLTAADNVVALNTVTPSN